MTSTETGSTSPGSTARVSVHPLVALVPASGGPRTAPSGRSLVTAAVHTTDRPLATATARTTSKDPCR
jgi:hypothetical protein